MGIILPTSIPQSPVTSRAAFLMVSQRRRGGDLPEALEGGLRAAPHLSEIGVTEQGVSAAVKACGRAVPASHLLSWPPPQEPAEQGLGIKAESKVDVASVFLTELPAR